MSLIFPMKFMILASKKKHVILRQLGASFLMELYNLIEEIWGNVLSHYLDNLRQGF